MFKTVLAIFLVFCFAVSMVPRDAFCGDDHQQKAAAHEHCGILCQCCFSVVVPVEPAFVPAVDIAAVNFTTAVSYTNPTMTRLKRPPIRIS